MDDTTTPVGGGAGDNGATPQTQTMVPKTSNEEILLRAEIHPLTEFDHVKFIDLLEHSLSLSTFEKKRVIDAIPILSQFQIDELTKVFEDERNEFKKLLATEWETIKNLVVKANNEWEQLKIIYTEEEAQAQKQDEEQAKIEEMKKSLGL